MSVKSKIKKLVPRALRKRFGLSKRRRGGAAGKANVVSTVAERIVARSRRGSSMFVRTSRTASSIEPVMRLGPDATFGGLFGPDHSVDEAAALTKLYDARMKQLADAFKTFGPQWAKVDLAAFNAFTLDHISLQARYAAAKGAAERALLKLDPDTAYTTLSKAMRQNYPPDGATLARGDWADLFARITNAQKAAGAPMLVDQPPADLADVQSNTVAMKIYKATAPYDLVAQAKHEEAAQTSEGANLAFWLDTAKWIREHQKGILIGAAIVLGASVLLPILSTLMVSAKAAKLAAVAAA